MLFPYECKTLFTKDTFKHTWYLIKLVYKVSFKMKQNQQLINHMIKHL